LLAIALLVGGLAILVLDLGRPDRIGVAMTHYNFRSIFAWNILLYTGFLAITALYLWVQMEPRLGRHTRSVGTAAFLWRLILTTGTGSICGGGVRPGMRRSCCSSPCRPPSTAISSCADGRAAGAAGRSAMRCCSG
jgi:Ni/Fe-hydrogenase subunit HybB-like protein